MISKELSRQLSIVNSNNHSIDISKLNLEEKIILAYFYGRRIVNKIVWDSDKGKDLVGDMIEYILLHQDKFSEVESIKAYVYRIMKFKFMENTRKWSTRSITNDDNYLNFNVKDNVNIEAAIDCNTILDFIKSGKLFKHNEKHDNKQIFLAHIEGYEPKELGEAFNLTSHQINISTHLTREKLRKRFSTYNIT